MSQTESEPGLFEGTAWYYSRYRPEYPPEAIDALVRHFELGGATHVLDLGCGTGQVAIPLAAQGVSVYATDPDIEMLAEGLRAEQRRGVNGIAWIRGDDKTLQGLHLPQLRACVMAASFHWMERDRVLQTLDRMIEETGGIAIFSGTSVWSNSDWANRDEVKASAWPSITKDVIVKFLGPERRAGGGVYNHPADRHEVVLARSAFPHIEKFSFLTSNRLSVEDIVGLQLSTSYASPAQLGSQLDRFKSELSERLREIEPAGIFCGETRTELIVARR